jgi:hypothetical protein
VFNLLPGQGLGFTGSKLIAFGLAPVVVTDIVIPPPIISGGGGGGYRAFVFDNAYSRDADDSCEVVEILSILFGVMTNE